MFYSNKRDRFPHQINTDEVRENLTSDWGVRVHGRYNPVGFQIAPPDENANGQGVMAIHYAMKLLEKSGKPDLLRAYQNEVNALLNEIDRLKG